MFNQIGLKKHFDEATFCNNYNQIKTWAHKEDPTT